MSTVYRGLIVYRTIRPYNVRSAAHVASATMLTVEAGDMTATLVRDAMAKKKSEARRHTAMMRVDADTLERARLAASLMRMSLADYASDVLRKSAEKDI